MTEQQRIIAEDLVQTAVAAADPGAAIRSALRLEGEVLQVADRSYDLHQADRILIVGAGKASLAMAKAIEDLLGDRISDGLVLTKAGSKRPFLWDGLDGRPPQRSESAGAPQIRDGLDGHPHQLTVGQARSCHSLHRFAVIEGSHPLPDDINVQAARRIADLLEGLTRRDIVIGLFSGGGSSLLTLPGPGLALTELQAVSNLLLGSGATIQEMNAVRKHLSGITGGQLAKRAAPAQVLSLILSDVVGDPLDAIASGPTAPDPTTFADALGVLSRYSIADQTPRSVLALLQGGAAGRYLETPKPGDLIFERVQNCIVGSNELSAEAAMRRAEELGFHSLVLSTYMEGEAREVGRVFAALLREEALQGRPLPRPACLIAGGETTVTLQSGAIGQGGRNQELALSAALHLDGLQDVLLVALATDGNDGPTDAGGAMVDGKTVARGLALGWDAKKHLLAHDAYPYFAALGDLILLGPTGTNVNDLTMLLAF